jgi:hypothetical protein
LATHDFNTIFKFADDTVVGLVNDDNETANREEVSDLVVWCQDNNLSLNVTKTKKLIVNYRKWRAENALIHIDGAVVVARYKFLCVHTTKEITWPKHTNTVVKKVRQCLLPLRRLKRFDTGPWIIKKSTVAPLRAA